jgi:hypothetical protein
MAKQKEIDDCKSLRLRYRDCKLYLTVVYDGLGNLCDMHSTISAQPINDDRKTLSGIDAMTALAVLAINNGACHEDVVATLLRHSRGNDTFPGILAKVIMDFGFSSDECIKKK